MIDECTDISISGHLVFATIIEEDFQVIVLLGLLEIEGGKTMLLLSLIV